MKALAILAACLCFAVPAQAFVHAGGPHGMGPHSGPGRGHHRGFGGIGLGGWGVGAYPEVAAPDEAAAPSEPPIIALPPAPFCPTAAPPPPKPGPHIIYIGNAPTIHGPKVIYGSQ